MRVIQKAAALLVGVAACHPPVSGGPAPASSPPAVTVRQVLSTQALVGETVVVAGRCLGYAAPTVAKGARPLTGHDWQFEDNGLAVWVTGPMPRECGGTTPAAGTARITARVAQDTIPVLSPPRMLRQYLVTK